MPDMEKVIKGFECCTRITSLKKHKHSKAEKYYDPDCEKCGYKGIMPACFESLATDALVLLKEQEAVVHPEPSCEMTYITNCCCDLCGVQLIREDNFCRCCGKRIEWGGR